MRNMLRVGLLVVMLFTPSFVAAGEKPDPRLVTVTGDADVRVVPDEVIVTLGIETWDKDLDLAKKQNDETFRNVMRVTRDLGIEPRYVETDYLEIEPKYDRWDERQAESFKGYLVRKHVKITLKEISRFEELLTQVLKQGVNYLHGIQFRTTELRKHKDQARALAIRAAKEKATALAGELGQKVGRPREIREEYANWWSYYGSWWGSRWGGAMAQNVVQNVGGGGAPGSDESTVAPGQITVNARVSVSFELE